MKPSKILLLMLCAGFVLLTTGAQVYAQVGTQDSVVSVSAEALLEADTDMNMVEEDGGAAMDPALAHLNARKNVNPSRMSKDPSLIENAMRILKGERENSRFRAVRVTADEMRTAAVEMQAVEPSASAGSADISDVHPQAEAVTPIVQDTNIVQASASAVIPTHKPPDQDRGHIKDAAAALALNPPPLPSSPSVSPAVVGSGQVTINKLRCGEHSGKTRLVLDSSDHLAGQTLLNQDGTVLRVEMPGAVWFTQDRPIFNKDSVIQDFNVLPLDSGGVVLEVQLRKPTKILFSSTLAPVDGAGHRMIIDLANG